MSRKKPVAGPTFRTLFSILIALLVVFIGNRLGLISPEDDSAGNRSSITITAITAPQDIADYIFKNGELPGNFITKKEAEKLGWDSSKNYVSDVAPGKSIGGDRFGNYEKLLPDAAGRTWKEADANYTSGKRGAERIVFSNDGLVYYTKDHYESFVQMKPSR